MHKMINLPIKIFVNRKNEQTILRNLILDKQEGIQVIVVKGNIGVGKTRLMQEVLKTIEWRDIVWGDCSYLADYVAYYAIRELVKSLLQNQGREILKSIKSSYKKVVGKLIPEVLDGSVDRKVSTEPLVDKFAFYEGINKILGTGTRAKVIVVDNIQWVDQASTNLLRYLIKAHKQEIVTFVFIYRTDEETEVLNAFLAVVNKTENMSEIIVEPFSRSDVTSIIEAVIGEEPASEFVDYVYRWSGGNPFYMEEIISALVLGNHLTFDHTHWYFSEPESGAVPRTIADIAKAKYLSLSSDARQVLEIASVVGWFDIQILQETTGLEPVRIVETIEEIGNTGMVRYGEERIEFSDEISRNAVYEQAHEKMDVKSIHRGIGDAIKQRSRANEHAVVHELAYHYYHGSEREKGVRFCIQAGDSAREHYAHQEAIRYYSWALTLLKGSEKREKLELIVTCLDKRIEVYSMIGDYERTLEDIREGVCLTRKLHDITREIDMTHKLAYTLDQLSKPHDAIKEAERAVHLANQSGDQMRVARAFMLIANIQLHFGNSTKALEKYTEALTYFERVDDKKKISSIHASLGTLYRNLGRMDQARSEHERALTFAQQVGDKRTIASCLIGMGNIHHITGNYDEALKAYEEAYRLNRDIGYKQGIAISCGSLSNAHVALGKYRTALEYIERSLNMKREIEDKRNEAGDLANMSGIYTRLSEYSKAINALERALHIARDIEDSRLEAYILDHLGSIYYYQGNFPYAYSLHQQAQKLIKEKNFEFGEFYNMLSIGRLYLAQGKYSEAKSHIESAYDIAKHLVSKAMMIDATLLLCEYFLQNKDVDCFSTHIQRMLELAGSGLVKSLTGYHDLLFGQYYILGNEYTTAEKVLRSALQTFEEIEEQYNIGQVYYYLGILENAQGNSADHRAYLVTARGIFEAIGAKAWKERIDQEMT